MTQECHRKSGRHRTFGRQSHLRQSDPDPGHCLQHHSSATVCIGTMCIIQDATKMRISKQNILFIVFLKRVPVVAVKYSLFLFPLLLIWGIVASDGAQNARMCHQGRIDIPVARRVLLVPLDGRRKTIFPRHLLLPSQVVQLGGIDRITQIIEFAIRNKCNPLFFLFI